MEPMRDFAQLQLHFVDQIQSRYEVIRPLVLLADRTATQRAQATHGSVAKFDFRGKIRKSGIRNSMTYRRQNSRKSNFATEPVALVDPVTHAYLPAAQLRAQFAAVGALDRGRVITYCGGGIAASSDAFVLTLLGRPDVEKV